MSGTTDLAEGWDTHTTEQGLTYYHNRVTGETTWQRPDGHIRCEKHPVPQGGVISRRVHVGPHQQQQTQQQ